MGGGYIHNSSTDTVNYERKSVTRVDSGDFNGYTYDSSHGSRWNDRCSEGTFGASRLVHSLIAQLPSLSPRKEGRKEGRKRGLRFTLGCMAIDFRSSGGTGIVDPASI